MATIRGPRIVTDGLVRMYDLSQFGGWGIPLTYDSTSGGYFYANSLKERVNGTTLTALGGASIPLHTKNNVRCRSTKYNNPENSGSGGTVYNITESTNIPITGNSNRTVEFWVYQTDSSAQGDDYGNSVSAFAFIRWGAASNTQMCVFGIQGADRLFVMGWGATPVIYSSTVTSFVGRWAQIAFTNNGNNVTFYVNGESAGTGTFAFATTSSGSGDYPFYAARGLQFTTPTSYDAAMRIYNRQLSATEIKSNFLAQKGKFGL